MISGEKKSEAGTWLRNLFHLKFLSIAWYYFCQIAFIIIQN